jgi:hypothetical protein
MCAFFLPAWAYYKSYFLVYPKPGASTIPASQISMLGSVKLDSPTILWIVAGHEEHNGVSVFIRPCKWKGESERIDVDGACLWSVPNNMKAAAMSRGLEYAVSKGDGKITQWTQACGPGCVRLLRVEIRGSEDSADLPPPR